jgi:hypothetical protein
MWKVALQKLATETGNSSACPSLPARHEQVEQDRTARILPHHAQLAATSTGESRSHHQPHSQHHDQERIEDSRRRLYTGNYPTGITVTDEELAALNLERADFHGEWNYKLLTLRKK